MKHNIGTMNKETQAQSVIHLAKQKGIIRSIDLKEIGIPRAVLTRLVMNEQLIRVGRGLYRLPETDLSEYESLTAIATKVPQAIFCLLTALQFHGLTTQIPRQVWITMPQGSHTPQIDYPRINMIQASTMTYSEGIEIHERDNITLRIYSIDKTIADCFKHRNKIGLDVALEALKDAKEQKKTSPDKLWRFAKINRVANIMRPYLEALE